MTKLFRTLLVSSAMLLMPLSVMADNDKYREGQAYSATSDRMAKSTSDKIEVIEMFSYTCPYCFRLDPMTAKWKETLPEGATHRKVPAIFRDSWLELARVFYASELTGDFDILHPALFKAIHVDKRRLNTERELLDFVAEQGIDRDTFKKAMDSFTVERKVKDALVISRSSGISGVPSMIVNNQYITDAPQAGSLEEMLDVVDFLIEKLDQ